MPDPRVKTHGNPRRTAIFAADSQHALTNREPTLEGVRAAALALRGIGVRTPLIATEIRGEPVHIKAECLQRTGSFKVRGAWWCVSSLPEAQRRAGVVAFSSGNHAQGVAWAAKRMGVPAAIVMPADAPAAKVAGTRALGAEVIFYDRLREDRIAIATALAAARGAMLVPPFDHPRIVEGQGTVGLEIVEQYREATGEDVRTIGVNCGGGGLTSGISIAVPDARIFAVEPEGWDDVGESLRTGEIVSIGPNPPPTPCDALQTLSCSPLTFAVMRGRGVEPVVVTEAEVSAAMRFAFETLKIVAEPGGAVSLAAALAGKIPLDRTVLVVSGGNVDPAKFQALTA